MVELSHGSLVQHQSGSRLANTCTPVFKATAALWHAEMSHTTTGRHQSSTTPSDQDQGQVRRKRADEDDVM